MSNGSSSILQSKVFSIWNLCNVRDVDHDQNKSSLLLKCFWKLPKHYNYYRLHKLQMDAQTYLKSIVSLGYYLKWFIQLR
jgi:hypothetical protein